jgi:protein TonB
VKDVRPQYPSEAQSAGVQGTVILELTLGTTGRVQDARVLRSIPMLDQAAVDAAKQWEYTPTVLNGAAVPVIIGVAVQFTLTQAPSNAAAGAGSASASKPARVGGNIKAPTKTRDVRPEYPPLAQSARVQGVVILEATIRADGRVQDARVLRSIPLLDQAAIDAVKQWEFTPTLLNGVAVPVIMTVTVQFTLSE